MINSLLQFRQAAYELLILLLCIASNAVILHDLVPFPERVTFKGVCEQPANMAKYTSVLPIHNSTVSIYTNT